MNIKKIWEEYFFKKRYIFSYSNQSEISDNIYFLSMADFDTNLLPIILDSRLNNYLEMRRGNSRWIIFYYEFDDEIYGYSFLHIPAQEEWHDSLPTMINEARTSATYVYPEYRGKGIRGKIFSEQMKYAEKYGIKLWSVIEDSNSSSLRASSKMGKSYRVNYLIKIMGRNIFSVLTDPFQVYLLLGDRREKR